MQTMENKVDLEHLFIDNEVQVGRVRKKLPINLLPTFSPDLLMSKKESKDLICKCLTLYLTDINSKNEYTFKGKVEIIPLRIPSQPSSGPR